MYRVPAELHSALINALTREGFSEAGHFMHLSSHVFQSL